VASGCFGFSATFGFLTMRKPDFTAIRKARAAGASRGSSYAQGVHPNPRFYKYVWWVFWSGSEVDGWEYLSDKYRLSTAASIILLADLRERGEPYWLYNSKLPRRDSANPFDVNHPKWQDVEWALPYDEDPDPAAPEPLAGHK
jgi:hypothetical protein